MKQCYMFQVSGFFKPVIADLIAPTVVFPYWMISRINVPQQIRGQGHGTAILNEILKDADAEQTPLCLFPVYSGGLTRSQLIEWYMRHGFQWKWEADHVAIMVRYPKEHES